jgi:hypothetical protein
VISEESSDWAAENDDSREKEVLKEDDKIIN